MDKLNEKIIIDKEIAENTKPVEDKKIVENNINPKNDIPKSKKNISFWNVLLIFFVILITSLIFVFVFILKPDWNYIFSGKLIIKNITVDNYNAENNTAKITIHIPDILKDSNIKCYLSIDEIIDNTDKCFLISNNKCEFTSELKDYFIILENKKNIVVNISKLTDYVNKSFYVKINFSKIYLAIGAEKSIDVKLISIGEIQNDIVWLSSNPDVASVENGKIVGINNGSADITVSDSYQNSSVITVVVTDLVNNFVLNPNKPLLKGKVYSLEEANLLDEILFSRVNEAGNSTRAGAVAAARFLTLEFPYSIPYFFENGRVNSSGVNYADGEGRYYHKGLYLHESKFESIEASFVGPAIWGMPLTNFDNYRYYVAGAKMPNGLDCSGFVSWALLNGGFDPGDYGAGEDADTPNQMTDLAEFVPITKKLLDSGTVKTGDLINFFGHIAIIIGIDGEDYYVAETLNSYGKLVVKKYTKSRNLRPFTHIVLMDSYYKEDGNYTEMW